MNEPTTAEVQLLAEAVKHYRRLIEQMDPDKAINHTSQRFGLDRAVIMAEYGHRCAVEYRARVQEGLKAHYSEVDRDLIEYHGGDPDAVYP